MLIFCENRIFFRLQPKLSYTHVFRKYLSNTCQNAKIPVKNISGTLRDPSLCGHYNATDLGKTLLTSHVCQFYFSFQIKCS